MIYNYSKLLGRIKEIYGTQEKFAKALGMGRVSLSQRLNCKLEFTQNEINRSIELLGLNTLDIPAYFFQYR
ncbi:DUF739 family protein [Anaeromicropila populeti]|uniref:DUF739 domain-containing protein n=1 Tax=Anaeromicropila populeti TaxID=37658 RepID=A0A1I6IKC9_9FIRM|nr:DUF739 family protein [Anaeromicropila populeti]SFR67148.1 Protein of unknown function [Anaeromicropila populeti]